jgi:uncharacterized protein YjbJ (UPF0337 family)
MFDDNLIRDQRKQLRGKAKDRWSKLTDDDLNYISGRSDRLINKLQERYGFTKDQADQQIEQIVATLPPVPQMSR